MRRSKFASLRPQHVLTASDLPQQVCLCTYHENVQLLLVVLQRVLPDLPIRPSEFVRRIVCDDDNYLCMFGDCKKPHCGDASVVISYLDLEIKLKDTKWFQWTTVDTRSTKTEKNETFEQCVNDLLSLLASFKRHCFIKKQQNNYFRHLRQDLSDDCCAIQVDFSENYTSREFKEVQNAH